ncbi:hypothetical protein ACIQLK_05770 [Microbacterium sp. NPDC091382]|uniref:hypothetical protein n=1 Tax=Microbacterium sp. NPDC091382 TaxID=3364210 RepID=UPI00380070A6
MKTTTDLIEHLQRAYPDIPVRRLDATDAASWEHYLCGWPGRSKSGGFILRVKDINWEDRFERAEPAYEEIARQADHALAQHEGSVDQIAVASHFAFGGLTSILVVETLRANAG